MKKPILILLLLFSMALPAQEAEEKGEVSALLDPMFEQKLELTELESANLSLLLKDVQLSQLQIQIVQSQYQTAVAQRDARQAKLSALLLGFRELHSAPAEKFTFDAVKMVFVPIPKEPKAEKD